MNEYKIKYEAPPVSEIVKLVFIKANNIDMAIHLFNERVGRTALIYSIELI